MARHPLGKVFPLLFAAALLQEMSFALLVHFPGYLSGLGVTESAIGVLYSAAAAVSLVFRPALGRILDLTHRRSVLLVTGISNALVVLSFVTAEMWGPYLWVLFLVQRGLQVVLFTTMLTYAADTIPVERRTQGLAIFGLSGLIPIGLGGYVGDVIIDGAGFGGLFVSASVAAVASWLLVWRLPVLPVRGRQPRRGFWHALAQRNLLPIWVITFSFTAGMQTLFTFTRTYVDDRGVGTAGLFFGMYGLAAAVTRIAGGSRYDRLPQRPLAFASIVVYGGSLVLLAFAVSTPALAIAAVLGGVAHGAVFPIFSSQVVNRARTAERGSAMSTFTSIFDIALLTAAPVVGVVIDASGYTLAFSAMGAVVVLGAVLYFWWDGRITDSTSRREEFSQ